VTDNEREWPAESLRPCLRGSPKQLKEALVEERALEKTRVEAWTRMGGHMIEVVRSIQRNEARMRHMTRVVILFCVVNIGVTIWAAREQSWEARVSRETVQGFRRTLATVDGNTARVLDIVLKQAAVTAKDLEARFDPEADVDTDHAVLEAAVDVQEKAAEARIQLAQSRREPAPPDARKALREAQEKAEELKGLEDE
jgi:hypothetical protein